MPEHFATIVDEKTPANIAAIFIVDLRSLTEQLSGQLDYGQLVSRINPFWRDATHKGTRQLFPFYPLEAMRQQKPQNRNDSTGA